MFLKKSPNAYVNVGEMSFDDKMDSGKMCFGVLSSNFNTNFNHCVTSHKASSIILPQLTIIGSWRASTSDLDPAVPPSALLVNFHTKGSRHTCLKTSTVDQGVETGFELTTRRTGFILVAITLITRDGVACETEDRYKGCDYIDPILLVYQLLMRVPIG